MASELDEGLDDLLLATDDFADLDEDLAKAMQSVEEEQQYKKDLAAKKRGYAGFSKEEIDFINSRMAAFEEARLWRPLRNIAVFTTFRCGGCGDTKRLFTRWMQEQRSRLNAGNRRWITTPSRNEKVETIVADDERQTDICTSCAPKIMDTHNSRPLNEVLR